MQLSEAVHVFICICILLQHLLKGFRSMQEAAVGQLCRAVVAVMVML
jgi:uncharacterized membrane protein